MKTDYQPRRTPRRKESKVKPTLRIKSTVYPSLRYGLNDWWKYIQREVKKIS